MTRQRNTRDRPVVRSLCFGGGLVNKSQRRHGRRLAVSRAQVGSRKRRGKSLEREVIAMDGSSEKQICRAISFQHAPHDALEVA